MKIKRLFCALALLLSGPLASRGDLLIYQFRSSSKNIGRGNESTGSSRGFVVWDLDSDQFTWIAFGSSPNGKFYRVSTAGPLVVKATGLLGRTFTTFSTAGSEEGRYFQDYNRGQDVPLKHRTGATVRFPRTFKGRSHTINTVSGPRLSDGTHTSVFSSSRTVTANDAGLSSLEAVEELRVELEANGYVDTESTSASQANGVINSTAGRPVFPPLPSTPYTPPILPPVPTPLTPVPVPGQDPVAARLWVESFTIPSKDF